MITSIAERDGMIVYANDDANRLLSVTYPSNKGLSYQYNLVGSRTRLTYTDSTYVDYTFDDLNRMDQVKDQNENVLADYAYDALRRKRKGKEGVPNENKAVNNTYGSYCHVRSNIVQNTVSNGKYADRCLDRSKQSEN